VLARLPRMLLVIALASSIGLHWAFLQVVAWTGMVVTYSQTAPVSEAVAKTFDGRHPCKLCKEIANAKKTDRKNDFKIEPNKFEFRFVAVVFIFQAPSSFWLTSDANENARILNYSPPIPPPRSLFT
jgi:hypothetical protein